jgi:hypothetical protein
MDTELKEEKQEPVPREYGFTVMVGGDGKIQITPHNLANDFELVGLIEYVNQKKIDILEVLGQSIGVKTLQSVAVLAKGLLSGIEKAAEGSGQTPG